MLTVEYLQALARIGDGRATKLVIPAEFAGLLGTVAALAEVILPDDGSRRGAPEARAADPGRAERVDLPKRMTSSS